MPIDLATKFQPYTDEQFSTESKKSLLTNQDFDWTGAHTIKVYKVSTSQMNDYGRKGPAEGQWSRYGAVAALDDAEVPETGRVLVVTPATYALMKKCKDITMETDVGNELRLKGVIGILDGMTVQKIPAVRLPTGFGFMVAHPCATVAPVKLEDYTIHDNPPGISGSLVEGRICYDAFVLDNKVKAIYYQAQPTSSTATDSE